MISPRLFTLRGEIVLHFADESVAAFTPEVDDHLRVVPYDSPNFPAMLAISRYIQRENIPLSGLCDHVAGLGDTAYAVMVEGA